MKFVPKLVLTLTGWMCIGKRSGVMSSIASQHNDSLLNKS